MEQELFDWEHWKFIGNAAEEAGNFIFQFDGIKLKVPIGKYSANQDLKQAIVDYEKGTLQLTDVEGNVSDFKIKFTITEQLS